MSFFSNARLRVRGRRVAGARRVQADERYRHAKRPSLVEASTIVAPGGRRGTGFASAWSLVDDQLEADVRRQLREDGVEVPVFPGHEVHDLAHQAQADLQVLPGSQIAEYCEALAAGMREMRFAASQETAFPNASVHAVRRDPALVFRAKLSAILVRVERDAALSAGDLQGVMSGVEAGESIFGSSESLLNGIYIFDVYLAPLEAALSPAVWVFAARRMHGTILISFGRPLSGHSTYPKELFSVLRHPGEDRDIRGQYSPFLDASAAETAISWWAQQIDLMFGVLSEPGVFARQEDRFDALCSMQARMSVEQLFRRVLSVQLAHRDTHARRTAFFSAMDTYRSLTGGPSMIDLFTLSNALKALERVRDAIPVAAWDILLPNADAAVAALREVQEGFFMTNVDGTVQLDHRRPAISRERAAAHYLATLRDATHGFSTTDARQREMIASLLTAHTGKISHDIGLLAWLYLLDFLVQDDRLERVLTTGHWATGPTAAGPQERQARG